MASWGYPALADDQAEGIDWRSFLVIVAVIFGLFLEAVWLG